MSFDMRDKQKDPQRHPVTGQVFHKRDKQCHSIRHVSCAFGSHQSVDNLFQPRACAELYRPLRAIDQILFLAPTEHWRPLSSEVEQH